MVVVVTDVAGGKGGGQGAAPSGPVSLKSALLGHGWASQTYTASNSRQPRL